MEQTLDSSTSRKEKKSEKSAKKPIIINLKQTKYSVVKQVTNEFFKWKSTQTDDWDIIWSDFYIQEDFIRRLSPHQRVNHFPGSYLLCKKNFLASHLLKLQHSLPVCYDFFPKTWILPFNYQSLNEYAESNSYKKVFIAKPEASCQGRGIFLTKKIFKTLSDRENYVVQEYLKDPYLIDGLKFDLRLYVLIKSVDPLKIFVYNDGLARFATEKFERPKTKNFLNLFMHLTNYSVNKRNPQFKQNSTLNGDEIGHKRSFQSILTKLKNEGKEVEKLKKAIEDMIIKTVCSVQPYLAHIYRANRPKEKEQDVCFEILGFDVILDQDLKPWLLEVNHTPSFSTDSELDFRIKFGLIRDTLRLINPKSKTSKPKKPQEILEYEINHLGEFKKIYPNDEVKKYEQFMAEAKKIWDQWSQGKKARVKKGSQSELVENPKRKSIRPLSSQIRNNQQCKTITPMNSQASQPHVTQVLHFNTNAINANNIQNPIPQTQNNIGFFSHIPQSYFPFKGKNLGRPKSAFNGHCKKPEPKEEFSEVQEYPCFNQDLRLVKDFLRPRIGGLVPEFNYGDLLKANNANPTTNVNFDKRNSQMSVKEFEDKRLQTALPIQKPHQFPSEALFCNFARNYSLKPSTLLISKPPNVSINKNLKKALY